MKTIVHVITSLGDGGAESLLYRVCYASRNDNLNHIVVSLKDSGKYGIFFHKIDIPVYCLNICSFTSLLIGFYKLYKILKHIKPDNVQTWLYHADFVGGICAKITKVPNIIWGIHNTTLKRGKSSYSTIFLVKILSILSYVIPDKIICCAYSALNYHLLHGYDKNKLVIIKNGYDTKLFYPSQSLRKSTRNRLGIGEFETVIGMVARNSPQKDYLNLLTALSLLKADKTDFRCLIVGKDVDKLLPIVKAKGLENRIELYPPVNEISEIYNALDIFVLSSAYGEASPNVIAEAMSCGIPCVATDVGDTKYIIGRFGAVVPAQNPQLLKMAINNMIKQKKNTEDWTKLKINVRNRIIENYSLDEMVSSYLTIWNR